MILSKDKFAKTNKFRWYRAWDFYGAQIPVNTGGFEQQTSYIQSSYLRPQFVDTLLIVRLRPNMSMCRAVIINY